MHADKLKVLGGNQLWLLEIDEPSQRAAASWLPAACGNSAVKASLSKLTNHLGKHEDIFSWNIQADLQVTGVWWILWVKSTTWEKAGELKSLATDHKMQKFAYCLAQRDMQIGVSNVGEHWPLSGPNGRSDSLDNLHLEVKDHQMPVESGQVNHRMKIVGFLQHKKEATEEPPGVAFLDRLYSSLLQ